MELTDLRTRMDPSWYYYNGASVFSSMAYERLANLEDIDSKRVFVTHAGCSDAIVNKCVEAPARKFNSIK